MEQYFKVTFKSLTEDYIHVEYYYIVNPIENPIEYIKKNIIATLKDNYNQSYVETSNPSYDLSSSNELVKIQPIKFKKLN